MRNTSVVVAGVLAGLWLAQPAPASTGLPFLRLSSGASAAALAGAVVARPGAEAISYNPAALQVRGQRSFGFTHSEWIQDIRHDYIWAVFARQRSSIGIAAQVSQARDLEFRTGPTVEPQGEFGVYDGVFNLAWAHPWNQKLRVGANLKLIRQSIYTETATGSAVDLGLLYRPHAHLHLGLALRNFGRMSKLDQTATALPRAVRAGGAYTGFAPLFVGLEVQRAAGGSTTLHLGGEYAIHPRLLVRGGYQSADTRDLTLGLGIAAGSWSVDYAFIPFSSGLGEAHRFSVLLHQDMDHHLEESAP